MVQYLAKRIGRSILTLFVIVTLVFCLLRLMPVEGYFANYEKMTEAQIQAGLQSMGLLDPLPVQIGHFWVNALHGDLGVSHIYKLNAPVTRILAQKLPISIEMGVLAMLLSLVLGIPLGLVMGRYKGRWPDKLGTAFIVLIQAVPAAVYFLYIQMYGTTAMGVGLLFDAANWRYWVLPVCSMSLANLAFYAMWLRRYMVDESNKDYVKLARAKGVSESNIALHHVFRNAMVPLVQYIPSAFLNTVVGSIYIESLYSIPGMGGLLVTCVQRHDNTMVQGIVLLYACVGIVGLILGVNGVAGMLAGATVSGFILAVMMANSGGAWDNAKKYIESGEYGGKGSDNHKAAVVGDTVGDPFKDTSGPSINILIKLLSMVSIVFASVVLSFSLIK